MPEAFHIGELARRSGRSIHAIRWYEAQGLMPGVARDGGRRRVYSPDHVLWLELIDRLRLTGMTIAEIRDYARKIREGRSARAQLPAILEAHAARTRERIARQREALRLIERKIAFYNAWLETGVRPPLPQPPKPRRNGA
ncbi:MAG: MerR family transcriptional regulator [Hyphomicrobiaceae bacterium]|nr:MerR family transcriptional regulator [Hyphomicrobiaceae bacterium]